MGTIIDQDLFWWPGKSAFSTSSRHLMIRLSFLRTHRKFYQ